MHGKNGIAIKREARKHRWNETSKGRKRRTERGERSEKERERKRVSAGYYQDRTDSDLNPACVVSPELYFAPPGHDSQDGCF